MLPIILAIYGHTIYKTKHPWSFKPFMLIIKLVGLSLTIATAAALADIHFAGLPMMLHLDLPQSSGGIMGYEIHNRLLANFGLSGTSVLLVALPCVRYFIKHRISWLTMVDAIGKYSLLVVNGFFSVFRGMGNSAELAPANAPLVSRKTEKTESNAKPQSLVKGGTDQKGGIVELSHGKSGQNC